MNHELHERTQYGSNFFILSEVPPLQAETGAQLWFHILLKTWRNCKYLLWGLHNKMCMLRSYHKPRQKRLRWMLKFYILKRTCCEFIALSGVSSASPATTGRDEWPFCFWCHLKCACYGFSTLNKLAMCMLWDLCIKREEMSMLWDLDIKRACYVHAVDSFHLSSTLRLPLKHNTVPVCCKVVNSSL